MTIEARWTTGLFLRIVRPWWPRTHLDRAAYASRIAVGQRRIGAKGGAGVGANELPPPGGVPKRARPRGVGSKDAFGMTLPQCQFDDSLAEPGRTLSVSGLPMAQGLTG
ncbi:hypothetical protein [Burkholderia glumae]|uniref:hypothetical protein n=1 Tax=Burkholderia glumae TaxID=337 RepID=UPI001296E50A|nr:hypothetical protein [Burkholderia glumae]MCM2550839.1 hypothetical protein [Burkholderia glumae]NVE24096.1 hypothetical protein [Burkholderia glumae]QGA40226.1 hypothetical protein GAS19_21995 [Burkholderia glumae]